jgi:hypothetical protein
MHRLSVGLALFTVVAVSMSCGLIPPEKEFFQIWEPDAALIESDLERYSIGGDGVTLVYDLEGLQISVRPMNDRELNEKYPEESYKEGKNSTNPYTHGIWVDPNLGYTPPRFMVCDIGVFNFPFAKIRIQPQDVLLKSDRGGRAETYDINEADNPERSFERYYAERGGGKGASSGVSRIQFEERMGIVRSSLYRNNEPVFKNDRYQGFLVFDPVDSRVRQVTVTLYDVALKFDVFGDPVESIDIPFTFNITQGIREKAVTAMAERTAAGGSY